ncbi:MAG: hypothetical protein WA864_00170 [Acetobacteraceae bacterium]|jgi:hypothetical protein
MPFVTFLVALGLAVATLAVRGTEAGGIRNALQVTARFSFLLFWCAYAGGALGALFGSRFRTIARHTRDFGLAFASAHAVHIVLVVRLYQISPKPPIPLSSAIFFGIALFWTYLLAVLSIRHLSRMLNPWLWRILLVVGMEYIEYAFLRDFLVNPLHANAKQLIAYLPFALLGLLGTSLRLAKWSRSTVRVAA